MELLVVFFTTSGIVVNTIILWLLIKSKKELPQKILILFFALTIFYLAHNYAEINKIRTLYITTFIFNSFLEIAIGPLLLIYIKSIFQNKKRLIEDNFYHFVPLLLFLTIISLPFFISILKREFIFDYLETVNQQNEIISVLMMIYLIFYLIWSLKLFYDYKKVMKSNFSTISENDFRWIKLILVGTLVISGFDFVTGLYEIFIERQDFETQYITILLIISLIIYLGYYGIKQSTILLPDFLINNEKKSIPNNKKNNHLSNLDDTGLANLKLALENSMLYQKLYLDDELTLNKLASAISSTDKKLSTFLNQYLHTTFYDYINSYRVSSVIEKLKSDQYNHLTLLGIAYESGFKSKTSFNRIFKKETGLSPSEYKKSLLKQTKK